MHNPSTMNAGKAIGLIDASTDPLAIKAEIHSPRFGGDYLSVAGITHYCSENMMVPVTVLV